MNNMLKQIKLFFINYLIQILLGLASILWFILLLKGWISVNRLIIFILILLYIWVYKKLVYITLEIDPQKIKNEKLLWILINIDKIKLCIINFIMYMYIW